MTMNLPIVADSFTLYLAEIRRFPLLDAEEEKRLAVSFYEEKDLAAAHTLITSNLRFVVKICTEYRAYGMKMLDLIQEGNIGLMMAVRKFNPYKGVRLISYAVWWIRAYVQNFIVSNWSLLKIGTTQAQKKLFFKLNQAKNAIKSMLGHDNLQEAAIVLDVKESEVIEMDQRMRGDCSLDAELEAGSGHSMLDSLPDERRSQEELLSDHQEAAILQKEVARAMEKLNDKERYIIEHRVAAEEPETLQEIAEHFAISRERVRQIEEGARKKLRSLLTPLVLDAVAA